jgi:hypothetical protein
MNCLFQKNILLIYTSLLIGYSYPGQPSTSRAYARLEIIRQLIIDHCYEKYRITEVSGALLYSHRAVHMKVLGISRLTKQPQHRRGNWR